MSDWQDWNGDGKVTNDERAFTHFMINDMNKRAGKKGGGCLSCILLFLVLTVGAGGLIGYAAEMVSDKMICKEQSTEVAQEKKEIEASLK